MERRGECFVYKLEVVVVCHVYKTWYKSVKGRRFLEQITFFIEIIQSMVLMKTNDFLYNKLFTFSCSNIISRFKKKITR